jgi:integrase
MEPLSAAEGRRLLKAARSDRLHALYQIAIRLGLRRGEVLGLRWRDVDLDAGTLSVRQTLQRVSGRLIFAPPKTARSKRTVALPAECVDALTARRKDQRTEHVAAGPDWAQEWRENELIFTTRNGTPIEPRNLNRSFASLLNRAGLRQVRFHDLRHTCASLLHERGEDARTIMEVLGHSSIRVTMDVYTFVRLDEQRSAIDRLGELLRDVDDESDETDDDDGDDPPAAVKAG